MASHVVCHRAFGRPSVVPPRIDPARQTCESQLDRDESGGIDCMGLMGDIQHVGRNGRVSLGTYLPGPSLPGTLTKCPEQEGVRRLSNTLSLGLLAVAIPHYYLVGTGSWIMDRAVR